MISTCGALLSEMGVALRGTLRPRGAHGGGSCGTCIQFRDDPAFVEAQMPGLASMSSGYASVRAADGICLRHDRYLGADAHCADYSAVVPHRPQAKAARS